MQKFCSGSPAVWVLMLDRTVSNLVPGAAEPGTSDVAEGVPTSTETGNDVLDRLDAESTCFEQFLLQDVRSNRAADAVFGEASFQKLEEFLRKAGQTASLVRFNIGELVIPENSNSISISYRQTSLIKEILQNLTIYLKIIIVIMS